MRKVLVALVLAAVLLPTAALASASARPATAQPPGANLRWDRAFAQKFVRHVNARDWPWVRVHSSDGQVVSNARFHRSSVGRLTYKASRCRVSHQNYATCYIGPDTWTLLLERHRGKARANGFLFQD